MPSVAGILEDAGVAGFAGAVMTKENGHALRCEVKGTTGREAVYLV
ncbi:MULTISPECIES: hypothetical protein [Enterobacteriaceae]|uniref:Uncharacterized protein n=1 Tax=Klebsiella pneumoniae TaxID=573 RepID=A0A7D5K6L4_KLEPN|nr:MULTISPECIES: hypothetical protein [Enterobacteriaceae]QLG02499.1 hypothetical protein [Klebsiella pneumoniae]URR15573.1 hypothetical protein LT980_25460 [Citrobacter portucalensis]WPC64628.1 hypothetical protein Q8R68_23015 [Escherichia coli]WPI29368.1 hypothetical protein R8550_28825 [Klebsiella oxytoca]WPI56510.1 hypothetical protein R8547_28220 [Klebsiella oxytoca]